jgi:hypothetical protein
MSRAPEGIIRGRMTAVERREIERLAETLERPTASAIARRSTSTF